MIIPIHHVQGDRRSAGSEVGLDGDGDGDDDRHRQHDRRVLINLVIIIVSFQSDMSVFIV